jgi:hypothetical protein
MDCPECEMCCALAICCPPASTAQTDAIAALIVKDGKWTDPSLAWKIADAAVKRFFSSSGLAKSHEKFQKQIEKIVAEHTA